MTQRPNGSISLSSTDVLIAMLSNDLRGSWARPDPIRSRARVEPAASAPPPVIVEPEAPGDPEPPAR